jgi:hypothetical protein
MCSIFEISKYVRRLYSSGEYICFQNDRNKMQLNEKYDKF